VGAFVRPGFRQLLLASHAGVRQIAFRSDLRPKKNSHSDTGQDSHYKKKEDTLHNLLRQDPQTIIIALAAPSVLAVTLS